VVVDNKMFKDLNDYGFKTSDRFYVIAEIGINHGGDLDDAKRLIDSAARSGANAVKFQTYLTEKRVPKDSPIFEILKTCELPLSSFEVLKNHADSLEVDFFSTPFDRESVECLSSLNVPLYKIASFDVVNHSLLSSLSLEKTPVIMSVGMSSLKEINEAYEILSESCPITLLHCISAYPTHKLDSNLSAIDELKKNFDCVVGQSDHTNGIQSPLYAYLRGAQVLEKHYKINDSSECVDSPVSITENQMSQLIQHLKEADRMLGSGILGIRSAEIDTVPYRRFSK
jgi:N,N'-diacetyllegionaminate synthase